MGLGDYILEYIIYADSGYDPYNAVILLSKRDDEKLLTREFKKAVNNVQNGDSFQKAIAGISERCCDPDLDSFLRIITRGYVRGEGDDVLDLKELTGKILHDQVSAKRERAEKANTKLSFPIGLIFIAIVMICIYPALCQFHY